MTEELSGEIFKQFVKKHLKTMVIVIIACIIAFIGAILVLIWFINTSPIGAFGNAFI